MLNINYTEKLDRLRLTLRTSWRLLGLLWEVDAKLLIANAVAVTIPAFAPFLFAYVFKLLIDQTIVAVANKSADIQAISGILAVTFAVYMVQVLSFNFQDYFNRLLYTKVPIVLYQKILSKISSLDMAYFEDSEFKNTLEKVRDSYHYRPLNMMEALLFTFQSMVQIIVGAIIISQLSWILLVIILVVAIPELINRIKESELSWGIWDAKSKDRKKFWYVANLLQERDTVKELKIFNLPNWFLSEIKHVQQTIYEENKKIATKYLAGNSFLSLLGGAVYIGTLVFVIWKALLGLITIGGISYYVNVLTGFNQGIGGLFKNIVKLFSESLYVSSIFVVLDAESKVEISKNPIKLNLKSSPKIEFKSVDFKYAGAESYTLRDFNLTINPGEKVALVGENGAGKSTIIKLLARFYDVTSGEILINDVNIKDIDLADWYKSIGVLFQDFVRYEYPVKENIRFGKIDEIEDMKKIIEAATSAGADPVIKKFAKGYEQMLGRTFEGGMELSAGQWQKIALARGFLRNAEVLVLDEPTSAIDAKAEAEIFNKVEKLSRDKTVIIISHRFSTVRNADKIYVIDGGKIVEDGSHETLMKLDGQYASLFKLQAKGYQ